MEAIVYENRNQNSSIERCEAQIWIGQVERYIDKQCAEPNAVMANWKKLF